MSFFIGILYNDKIINHPMTSRNTFNAILPFSQNENTLRYFYFFHNVSKHNEVILWQNALVAPNTILLRKTEIMLYFLIFFLNLGESTKERRL